MTEVESAEQQQPQQQKRGTRQKPAFSLTHFAAPQEERDLIWKSVFWGVLKSAETPNSEATVGVSGKIAGEKKFRTSLFVCSARLRCLLWTWCRRCALDRRCLRQRSGFGDEQRPLRGCPGRHRRSGKNSVPPHPHLSGSRAVLRADLCRESRKTKSPKTLSLSPPTVKVLELDLCFVSFFFFFSPMS